MHQLKALIWKSYKARLRSPLATFADVAGPILIISCYLIFKYVLSLYSVQTEPPKSPNLFRDISASPVDLKTELSRLLCPDIPYYANPQPDRDAIVRSIQQQCGLNLIPVSDRDAAIKHIQDGLRIRTKYKAEKQVVNLNRLNSTSPCLKLPSDNTTYNIYDMAFIIINRTNIEILDSETTTSRILFHPYIQGSNYNENRLPSSDMNRGYHLLDICLRNALMPSKINPSFPINTYVSNANNTNYTNSTINSSNSTNTNDNHKTIKDTASLKWRFKAYPILSSSIILHIVYMLFQLLAILFNACITVTRCAEESENGLHHYIRLTGVPAGIYWFSQLIVLFIHMTVQSLILASLLAIPVSNVLYDPIYETSITFRWALILSYSLAINTNAMLFGYLYHKASHAFISLFMIGVSYSMYPIMFMLQITPYGFSSYVPLNILALINPAANFQAILMVIAGIGAQTNKPFSFEHLNAKVINGGTVDWTTGELWLLLLAQIVFWLMLTMLIDLFRYRSTNNIIGLPLAATNEFCCCNFLTPRGNQQIDAIKTKTLKSVMSKKDPNRVCCSLRRVTAKGPTISVAHTKDNPLKMTDEQRKRIQMHQDAVSRAGRFLVNRNHLPDKFLNPNYASSSVSPLALDNAIQENIIWRETEVSLDNLSLDFKFNQVSFILGQTNVKDLLFATLLGLRPISSGHVILDETKYTPMTMGLARPHIGFLGEHDIFLNELTVFENLQFFGSLRESSYTGYDTESLYVLSLLHLTSRRDMAPSVLTTRSARKLALAVAAVGFTKLLLLVEPTLNLRWRPRCQVLNLLKKYKSIRSIVVDTSDIDEATAFGDRIVLLNDSSEVDMDGTPEKLKKKLCCGYWLLFESNSGNSHTINPAALKSLEFFTDKLFKKDKLERLRVTKRMVYHESLQPNSISSSDASLISLRASKTELERMQRSLVILKIKVSPDSTGALCEILRRYSRQHQSALRLADLTYESLEDIIVYRMSKAVYPHLPPDLLLSLQYRTRHLTSKRLDSPPITVRRLSSEVKLPDQNQSLFRTILGSIIRERLLTCSELFRSFSMIIFALIIMLIALIAQLIAINNGIETDKLTEFYNNTHKLDKHTLIHRDIEKTLGYRIGFYVLDKPWPGANKTSQALVSWRGNKKFAGPVSIESNKSDFKVVVENLEKSQDLLTSMIFFSPETNEATVVYEAHAPHGLLAGIIHFQIYHQFKISSQLSEGKQIASISRLLFSQPWHEMIWGYKSRRLIYGTGFAIAEGISIGMFVFAPVKHRSESPLSKMSTSYWIALALCDLTISLVLVVGYVSLFFIFEGIAKIKTIVVLFLVLVVYKLACLPVAYLISFTTDSRRRAFLFVFLIFFVIGWVFAIHLRTLVEWTLIDQGYLYSIAMWIILIFPVGALVDMVVNMLHLNRMQQLCSQVPAYTATTNLVNLDGPQRQTITDKLLAKVRECLATGKNEITYNILHQPYFGIAWNIYMILFFGILAYTFLLTSERFFGALVRRFSSARLSSEPLKTLVRYSESGTRTYKWDREKDRLVGEYIRSMSEPKYVETMTKNCIFLRIWLRPMGDQNVLDKQLTTVLEPLYSLGQPKSEVQLELKTTLQLFIRIGNEGNHYKVDKIQLIETYSRYIKQHSGSMLNFAVVDWSRESLYKILLHGHYNIRATSFYD